MTDPSVALLEYLRKVGAGLAPDFLREAIRVMSELLMEVEVQAQTGAARYERSEERMTRLNGSRDQTRVGEMAVRIPKLRQGSYFPSLLEPRRRAEQALLSVIQHAYIEGVSVRKGDDLVKALGLAGIDKRAVSRVCQEVDSVVTAFRERPRVSRPRARCPLRQNHRIVSQAVVIALGVRETGERDVLGVAVGASEEEAFWTGTLLGRGWHGVQLMVSDAHEGLTKAIQSVLAGASWQRCCVHFMRNVLARVPQQDKAMVAAAARTSCAQPTRAAASQQLQEVLLALRERWPQAAQVLAAAEEDVLTSRAFPQEPWTRISSTNLLERLNREVKRRRDVVGIFPDSPSVLRLVGAVVLEVDDEWQGERRSFSQDSIAGSGARDPALASTASPSQVNYTQIAFEETRNDQLHHVLRHIRPFREKGFSYAAI